MKETISEYRSFMELKNYSINTIDLYTRDLEDFMAFLKEYDNLTLEDVTKVDVLQYLYHLNERGNKSKTRHHKLNALKSFYKWYCREYGGINPVYDIESVKIAERLPRYLTLQQAKRIQHIFTKRNTMYYKKYNLIIKFFLNTGLRVSEVCNIKLEDIDMPNCSVKVKCKGNKMRVTYFTTKLKKELEIYFSEYKPHTFLFESKVGKAYSRRGIEWIVSNAYELMGLEGFTVHSLRHTVATLMYEKTKDILLVKNFLGHESLDSTMIYTHVSNDEIREAVRRNPLNE